MAALPTTMLVSQMQTGLANFEAVLTAIERDCTHNGQTPPAVCCFVHVRQAEVPTDGWGVLVVSKTTATVKDAIETLLQWLPGKQVVKRNAQDYGLLRITSLASDLTDHLEKQLITDLAIQSGVS